MKRATQWAGQALFWALFAVAIGAFSQWPAYRLLDRDEALLRLSFSHPGRPTQDCRPRTPEELAKLPPTMRAPVQCARERSPVTVRVALDGREIMHASFGPAGLSRDGASTGYRRVAIPAGGHTLRVQFNDDVRVSGPTYEREATIEAAPGQVVLIDLVPEKGGVIIR